MYLPYFVKINGIYDLLSSLCMLQYLHIPYINVAHMNMIYDHSPILHRYYAYWIFTYGCMRLLDNLDITRMSYIIEAAFTLNELLHSFINKKRDINFIGGVYIVVASVILAAML